MSETTNVMVGQLRYQRDTDGDWWVAFGMSNGATKWIPIAVGEMTRLLDALAAARRENETMRGWLSHLLSCLTCAEDGLSCCETGRDIDAALRGEGGSGDAK